MVFEFYLRGCKPLLKKHQRQEDFIKGKIAAAIERELETGMTKVKLASERTVAYLISGELQKSAFSRQIAKLIGGMSR